MGRLRLRHGTDGAQGVVELSRGGNSVPGESTVLVVTRGISTASGNPAITRRATVSGTSTTAKLVQKLVVFVLDVPFTRPKLKKKLLC